METRGRAAGVPAAGRRAGLNSAFREGVELWLQGASYAEIEGACELVREEIARRGQTFTWCITWPVVLRGKGGSDGS